LIPLWSDRGGASVGKNGYRLVAVGGHGCFVDGCFICKSCVSMYSFR
jgi:hypothetical protein